MAAENRLWALRGSTENYFKLGITVSERTVSRYLQRDRLVAPPQMWRTFLANHIGQLTLISPATSPCTPHADDVLDVSRLPFCQPPSWHGELFRLSSPSGRRSVCSASTHIMCHAYRSRYSRRHGHSEPHGPRTAVSLDRCADQRCLQAASLPLHGPLRRTTVSNDRSQADSRDLRQRCRKRLGSDWAVRVYVVIRTVVGILAKHSFLEPLLPALNEVFRHAADDTVECPCALERLAGWRANSYINRMSPSGPASKTADCCWTSHEPCPKAPSWTWLRRPPQRTFSSEASGRIAAGRVQVRRYVVIQRQSRPHNVLMIGCSSS
jgi:hypothetical protein